MAASRTNAVKMAMKRYAPGQGGRFQALKKSLSSEPGITNPGALAASIGRKKYGAARFQSMAAKGK